MSDQQSHAASESEFALFAGQNYYPAGGWDDCVDVYPSLDDAKGAVQPYHDWAQVVDLSICELVAAYGRRDGWERL